MALKVKLVATNASSFLLAHSASVLTRLSITFTDLFGSPTPTPTHAPSQKPPAQDPERPSQARTPLTPPLTPASSTNDTNGSAHPLTPLSLASPPSLAAPPSTPASAFLSHSYARAHPQLQTDSPTSPNASLGARWLGSSASAARGVPHRLTIGTGTGMSGKGDAEKSIDLSEDAEVFDLQELSRVLQSTREGKDAEGEGSGEPSVGRATDADDECGRGDRILLVSHHLHGIGMAQTLTDEYRYEEYRKTRASRKRTSR